MNRVSQLTAVSCAGLLLLSAPASGMPFLSQAVPASSGLTEPATMFLIGSALAGLAIMSRKKLG